MLDIQQTLLGDGKILAIGNHTAIIQSILDFNFISKKKPSIVGIVATGRKTARFFFGNKEILIPFYESISSIPEYTKKEVIYILNLSSGRRVLSSTKSALELLPHLQGGSIFAEGVPEKHALEVYRLSTDKKIFMLGPASVGLLVPGTLKLGAIGGTESKQLIDSRLFQKGDVAVMSSSGGMTNEIIRIVAQQKRRLSFALSFGGERFPSLTPKEAFLAAEKDHHTKTIVYFGELGGTDEYDLVALLQEKKITKQVICYIAGVIADIFMYYTILRSIFYYFSIAGTNISNEVGE